MLKAAFFDLDGTLQDSEIIWVNATREYITSFGVEFTEADAGRLVYGRSWRDVFAVIQKLIPSLVHSEDEAAAHMRDIYRRKVADGDIAIPGSVALLRRLAKRMPVAIVSGSPRADIAHAIVRLGLQDEVSFYVSSDDTAHGKPDPECYLVAARMANVDPADCVVFEDSSVGVKAAKDAGMQCVALSIPGRPYQDISLADKIVEDLGSLEI